MRRSADSPAAGDAHLAAPVASVASRRVLWAGAGATVAEAARRMREADVDSILVPAADDGDDGRTDHAADAGILTDRDLRRVLADGVPATTPAGDVATRPLLTLSATATVADAHLAMLEAGVHHLVLEDGDGGRVVGVVSRSDLHRHQSRGPFLLLHRIDRAGSSAPAVPGYALQREEAVRSLRRGGVAAATAGRIASLLDDHLTRHCLGAEIASQEAESGRLPAPWAWVVFGSDGRREQPVLVDQHNALVFDDAALDADAAASASERFHRLATRVGERLRASGVPEAVGGFVAHRWCATAAQWRRRFRHWLEEPDAESLEHAQVFFDLRQVAGDLDVGLQATWHQAAPSADFLRLLAAIAARRRPAVRRWRGLARNGDGEVDLVEGGMRPLVALARVAGLAVRLAGAPPASCSTPDRLLGAGRAGLLPQSDAERLLAVHRWLADRVLDLQLARSAAGTVPSARVRPADLGRHERRRLAADLRFVRRQQTALESSLRRFHGTRTGARR